MSKTILEQAEEIRKEIVFVQTYFGFSNKKMCALLGNMNPIRFRDNRRENNTRNNFQEGELKILKKNLKKLLTEYKF